MRDAVIVEAVRTPVGKPNGGLSTITPAELSAMVLNVLIERSCIDPRVVDDVVWGCVNQIDEQAFGIARNAILSAGWPETVPGTTVGRQCACSQQTVHFAAAGLISGQYDVVVAGGVASTAGVSVVPSTDGKRPSGEGLRSRYGGSAHNQGLGAEMIAERWGFSRAQLDEFGLESHEKAATAHDEGWFDEQLFPVPVPPECGSNWVVCDEGIRRGGSLEAMAQLRPAFKEDGRITAGNSSQIGLGAAALVMTTSAKAVELGLAAIARVHTAVSAGDDPIMWTAPIAATAKALQRSGLTINEIGAFEVHEAFASVPLAWLAESGADAKTLNPNGGAIALKHPLGGSSARMMTTLVHHMRDNNIRYGLQTMCDGGGQANATILELI